MFNFNREKINYKQKLGRGVSGTVYPYQKDANDKKWVVKKIMTDDVKEVLYHFNEIVLAFNCDYQHVLPVNGYHIESNERENTWEIYIKLLRMKCSLKAIIDEHKKDKESIEESSIVRYFYEAVKGLRYLQTKNIAHRDIKPDNLLLGEDDVLRVADFGLGNLVDIEASYIAEKGGTLMYAAPENRDIDIKIKKTDLFKADCWSLGLVILELCALDLRFLSVNSVGMEKQTVAAKKIEELRGKYSDKLLDLILDLLQCEPSKRKGLEYIQEMIEANYSEMINLEKQTKSVQVEMETSKSESESAEIQRLKGIIKDLEADIARLEKENEKRVENKSSLIEEVKFEEPILNTSAKETGQKEKNITSNVEDVKETEPNSQDSIAEFKLKWKKDYHIQEIKEYGLEIVINEYVMEDGQLKEFASQIGKNLKHLQHLSLILNVFKVNDYGMKVLASQIGNLQNLRHLSLAFETIKVEEQGITNVWENYLSYKELGSQIAQIGLNLKNLQHFSLSFRSQGFGSGEQGLKGIASQIGLNMKNLQQLSLSFRNQNMTDEGIIEVASQIVRNLQKLEHLSFCFDARIKGVNGKHGEVSNKGVKEVTSLITRNLRNLKGLSLSFYSGSTLFGKRITEKKLQEVTDQVRSDLRSLTSFTLNDQIIF